MPVVTIEPIKVNTIPYEEEQEDTIEFTITNYGLIRADNVRLVLPDQHPFLNFESVGTVQLCDFTATDFTSCVHQNAATGQLNRATMHSYCNWQFTYFLCLDH